LKPYIIKYLLLFAVGSGFCGLNAQCFKQNTTFRVGEKVTYDVYYNWGFLWLSAGWVEFKVDNMKYKGRDTYFFDSYGQSHKGYDWFFKVRDSYETYMDKETLQPLWFERKTSEGGYNAHEVYLFEPSRKKVFSFTETSKQPFKRDTLVYVPCSFDVLSLIYYARNIDFSDMQVRDTIPVIVLIDNEYYNIYIRYLGKEAVETRNGEKYQCLKFSAFLVEGTIFKGGEDLYVWVTDDKNRVPILVEAKILVGSVKAYLAKAEGLRSDISTKGN